MPGPDGPGNPPIRPVALGVIVRAQGLKGEVAIRTFNGESQCWAPGERFWVAVPGQPGRWRWLDGIRPQGRVAIGRFDGLATREEAEALVGAELAVDRSHLPPLDEDEVYLADMMGWVVVDRSGRALGRIVELVVAGKKDFLVVEEGGRRELVPVEPGLFGSADTAGRRLTLAVDLETTDENPLE